MEYQECMYCGKWYSIPENYSRYVYCKICGKDGKKRKREFRERV